MIYWLAIIYFLLVMYMLGLSVAYLTKFKGKDIFEDIVMKLAIGLGVFPLLTIILNWFHLINWQVIFLVSVIIPIISLFKKPDNKNHKFKFQIKKKHIYYFIALLLFGATLFIYTQGAFSYPYLEDGDPLSHALASKYISDTGSYSTPVDQRITHYLEPYPPFFPAVISVFLSLTKFDVVWTLKFFNAFIISFGTLFMFMLVKRLTDSNVKATISAFLILAINSYVSHFIFSAGYSVTMILPAMYFLAYAEKKQVNDKKFKLLSFKHLNWHSIILAGIIVSSVFLIQPITSGIFALFLMIYFLSNLRKNNVTKAVFMIILIGLIISQLFWVPAISKYGVETTANVLGFQMFVQLGKGIDVDSSGGVVYTFKDFMVAPKANKIDQPTGIGTALWLVFLISAVILIIKTRQIIKSKNSYSKFILPLLIWTLLLAFLIMGNIFPWKFVPHRLWSYFSIGIVLITVFGGGILLTLIKSKPAKIIIMLAFIITVALTSLVPKYQVQTSIWPPGPEFKSPEELQGYLDMAHTLPLNTKVFALCSADEKIAGSNMGLVYNDPELLELKNNIELLQDPNYKISPLLYNKGIKYVIVDTECAVQHGVNETNQILAALRGRSFTPAVTTGGFFLLQVP